MPAIRAKLGNTNYYILSMKAGELVNNVTIPSSLPGWDDMSVEERYQREINANRVKNQIAPYFACNETRFCGSIILTALNFDEANCFEPLSRFKNDLPNLYRKSSGSMGFLTLSGGEVLVPLDGQHRLQAISYAISGRDSQGKNISGIEPCAELAQEDITIILVAFEPKKARQIFTHVNRYAKPTTAGQNIVTDDDDFIAVLAREVANDIFQGRLVNYQSSTINAKAPEFTTLASIYKCNEAIISSFPGGKFDKSQLPDSDKQKLYRDEVRDIWTLITDSISPISDGIKNPEKEGDKGRMEIRQANLLGKPVAQEGLVQAYLRLTRSPTKMTGEQACRRLNALPWGLTAENIAKYWSHILWSGGVEKGKIVYKNRPLISRFIAYLAGENLTPEQVKVLTKDYLVLFSEAEGKGKKLPEPIKAA
jgi:DNA sulfur modification protein DndB